MIDEAVRAAAKAITLLQARFDHSEDVARFISESTFEDDIPLAEAAIAAYHTHTLAGAGECEKELRELRRIFRTHEDFDCLDQAADIIAAQREEINAWAKRWSDKRDEADNNLQDLESAREGIAELTEALEPFAKNADLVGNASDDMIIGLLANGIADAISVRDLRRARAALGRE